MSAYFTPAVTIFRVEPSCENLPQNSLYKIASLRPGEKPFYEMTVYREKTCKFQLKDWVSTIEKIIFKGRFELYMILRIWLEMKNMNALTQVTFEDFSVYSIDLDPDFGHADIKQPFMAVFGRRDIKVLVNSESGVMALRRVPIIEVIKLEKSSHLRVTLWVERAQLPEAKALLEGKEVEVEGEEFDPLPQ